MSDDFTPNTTSVAKTPTSKTFSIDDVNLLMRRLFPLDLSSNRMLPDQGVAAPQRPPMQHKPDVSFGYEGHPADFLNSVVIPLLRR